MKDDFKEISQLVTKIKAQDMSAFPRLYEITYQRLYFLCYSILKNEEDAKDAVQETYMKILASLPTLQESKLFVAWSNRIACNICIRMLSKQRPDLVEDELLYSFVDENQNTRPYEALERSEKLKALSSLIDSLEPVLRATLILKYFETMKIKQIALVMNCPEGTVKSRLNTAKKILKHAIEKERKGDILLHAFAYIPIRQALRYSAAQTVMAPEAANAVFQAVVTQNHMGQGLTFLPQPPAVPHPPAYGGIALAAGSAVAGTSAIALSAAVAFSPPAIHQVTVHQPEGAYTNGKVSVTATVTAPMQTFSELCLISDSGRKIDGNLEPDNLVRFLVSQNGSYTLHVVTSRQMEATATVIVTGIDRNPPEVVHYTYTETELVITLDDQGSGVDFTAVTGETAHGSPVCPLAVDETARTVTFAFPEENFRLCVKDLAGNISYHRIERVETQGTSE